MGRGWFIGLVGMLLVMLGMLLLKLLLFSISVLWFYVVGRVRWKVMFLDVLFNGVMVVVMR